MKITANNNKHIITSEIVWMRQLISSHVSFVSSSEILVAFNISSSYSKTNFTIRRFLHEQFLMFKIFINFTWKNPIYYGFTYNHLCKNFSHFIFYTYTYIYYDSIFALNYIHIILILNLHLHWHSTCWTKSLVRSPSDIKLDIFTFIYFISLDH